MDNPEDVEDVHVNMGYACLAAAIIESGIKANDKQFLESEWCQELNEMVGVSQDLKGYLKNTGRSLGRSNPGGFEFE